MSKALVIVESPAKAKTISKYLGKDFIVEASVGHIKDLPKNKIGVDLSDGSFAPNLIVIPGKEKVVDRLKKLAKSSSVIYLAPDPDREGEAIAAHLEDELRGLSKEDSIRRVTFNEITQKAVREAFEHTRDVDRNLVDAQQTRRVLDRIVGYQISPLLWDKVRRGLSAGRVQTVALRLIVEREREIQAFVPVEYWTLDAQLTPANDKTQFTARFNGIDGVKATVDTVDMPSLPGKQPMDAVVAALANAKWAVDKVEKKERRRNATAPFTTSKLQQDASRQLGFSVRRTMGVAQRLYEGIDLGVDAGGLVGLITYMRTDSTRVSPDAITEVRQWIAEKHGKEYLPAAPNAFKSKKDAQDAHEAVRPTSVTLHPDDIKSHLSDEQFRLYRLIWQRFVASQMLPAVFDQTTVDIVARADRGYNFRVTGSVMKFDGFLKVYEEAKDKKDEEDEELKNRLPALENGQALALSTLLPEQHMTEPRPRFNEASLVKELEERGIGRPSTYATIINTIQEREYVQKVGVGRGAKFIATEIGFVVTDLLVANFPYIFDPQYTARLEEELDDIEDGKERWTTLLGAFYGHFEKELKHAGTHMENIKRMEKPTDEKCDVCGSPLVLKWGKFGSFFACSTYDKKDKNSCTFTKENFAAKPEMNAQEGQDGEQAEEYCEACGRVMVLKRGRFGAFMACPGYSEDPPCKTTRKLTAKQQQKAPQPLDEKCPKCSEQLVLRTGQYGEFVSCSGYPKCKYIKQNLVEGMKCPTCGDGDIAERKARRGNLFYGCTNYPKCDFTSNFKPVPEKCPECGSPYLLEKTRVAGTFLVCPNNRKAAAEDEAPKKRAKKGAVEESAEQVVCGYSKKIAEPQAEPVESLRYQVKAEALPVA